MRSTQLLETDLRVLFTHAAFLQLERSGYTLATALRALGELSVTAIEAVLVAGLEGARERESGGRGDRWTTERVRGLFAEDGALWQYEYGQLVDPLVTALTTGARRGKATPAAPASPETPAS